MFAFLVWSSFIGLVGSVVITRPYFGEIKSPNFPNPYPNDNASSWDIMVPKGFSVKLTFWQFDLEPSESCLYDYVKISADKKDLGRYCGQVGSKLGNHPKQRTFVSRGNRMRLFFKSDFSNEENGTTIFYKGFLAYYQAVDLNECAQTTDDEDPADPPCSHICHNYVGGFFCSCRPGFQLQSDRRTCQVDCSSELYTEESGLISSPEYPQPYPPNLQCNYSIRLEKGLFITLKFLDTFEIDDHQQVRCPYDLLKIEAGEQEIGTYCGRESPGLINTKTHTVDLIFTTDDSGDSRGWKIRYTSERVSCPQPVPLDEFSIIKPQIADYRYQDYIIVSCKTGYKLMENGVELRSFTAICQNDGTWHRDLPRCEIVSCMTPQELTNGVYKYQTKPDVNTYQSVIKYECNEPYYRMVKQSGEGPYTCTAERRWKDTHGSEGIPQCLPVCGNPKHPVEHTGKIIGGDKAKAGNFPWQVYVDTSGPGGGALISDRWILTAAHMLVFEGVNDTEKKVSDVTDVHVFMGDIDVHKQIELAPYPVESVFFHPKFIPVQHNFDNDIALIKLSKSVTMSADIMPICLPWKNNSQAFYEGEHLGYVSGFGTTENNTISSHLRYVRLPVARNDKCKDFLKEKKVYGQPPVFSDNMFCAGFPPEGKKKKNKDSCQGDSGGAFTVWDQEAERWVATGIVSWGIECGRGYGFYTKVNNYKHWIEEVMKGEPPVL
ncbi:complement C1r subcomponent-like [Lissotriton helveticus]